MGKIVEIQASFWVKLSKFTLRALFPWHPSRLSWFFSDVDVRLHGFVIGMAGEFHHNLGRDADGEVHADAVQQTRFQINIAIFVKIILPL